MSFEKGDCTLVNTDASPADNSIAETYLKYEYNLYRTARRLYPQNPSAGFGLLRFGRVISTGHKILTPANAPLWRTVSFPGGTCMVNLASPDIKKFSDADFPHWTGWRMVNDDTDNCSIPVSAVLILILPDG